MPDIEPTPLAQAEENWKRHAYDLTTGRVEVADVSDMIAVTQMAISLSIAHSLEAIAAVVDDGNVNYWVERFTGALEASIHNGIRGGTS